jgi:hypothetical protein
MAVPNGKEQLISLLLNMLAGVAVFVQGAYFGPKSTIWMGMTL